MEHIRVLFRGSLPFRLEKAGDRSSYFSIPKSHRLKTVQFMNSHPQHILRKGKKSWEVIGTLPLKMKGGRQNNYRSFLSGMKKVLSNIPDHELSNLPLIQLQKIPQIKRLYDRYFKHNPELINERTLTDLVASSILGYDNNTGAVRESIADVRKRSRLPKTSTTAPSLQTTKEHEFDRMLLLIFHRFLSEKGIPELFLKSSYFTLRPQLLQLSNEHPSIDFRVRVEQGVGNIETEIWRDYKALVNETNRMFLARYPFDSMAVSVLPSTADFSSAGEKLRHIKQNALTVPGANQKFTDLQDLTDIYTQTNEAKLISAYHFAHGLQDKMTNDSNFVQSILKNRSRTFQKLLNILQGKSL